MPDGATRIDGAGVMTTSPRNDRVVDDRIEITSDVAEACSRAARDGRDGLKRR